MKQNIKCFVAIILAVLMFVLSVTASATEKITYFHNDYSGSPILATDSSGYMLWKENYLPYGEMLNKPSNSSDNSLWYTGKSFDQDSGLSYMGARYYDPILGRFTGIDPEGFSVENIQSFNRYAYANNNPYSYVDPDGMNPLNALDWGMLGWDIGTAIYATYDYAMYGTPGALNAWGDVAVSTVGVVNPVPGTALVTKVPKTTSKVNNLSKMKTVEQSAAELLKRNSNKHRVKINTVDKRFNVDLRGSAHYEKKVGGIDVPTPHTMTETKHTIPAGRPGAGTVGSTTKNPTRPTTHKDLRIIRNFFKSQGK